MIDNPYAGRAMPRTTGCKCCSGLARLAGVVDFSKSCRDGASGPKTEPLSGWPIYYYSCRQCGFTFTRAFDNWTSAEFSRFVYNDRYTIHDPEYEEIRPRTLARIVNEHFSENREDIIVLDYGSGSGQFGNTLFAFGFASVTSYDPFSSPSRPTSQYDMITCFEVFEHVVDPQALVADLASFLSSDGAIFLTTGICTEAILDAGLQNWDYCSPRNGHISFYSLQSLRHLAETRGLTFRSLNETFHFIYRDRLPAWIAPYVHD